MEVCRIACCLQREVPEWLLAQVPFELVVADGVLQQRLAT